MKILSIENNKTTEQAILMAQHSKHPPSSLYRDLGGCTGWSSLAQEVEQPKANFAAFLGTAVHEISETILKNRIDNLKVEDYWLGKTMMVEDVEINIEQEHCDWAKFYTDYVNKRQAELEADKYIERKVFVTEINQDSPLMFVSVNDVIVELQKKKIINSNQFSKLVNEIIKKEEKTLYLAIYNSSNQRSYITVKLK